MSGSGEVRLAPEFWGGEPMESLVARATFRLESEY